MFLFTRMKLNRLTKKLQALNAKRTAGQGNVKDEIALLKTLAKLYDTHRYNPKLPHARERAREAYRMAGQLGDTESLYLCALKLLDEARFWEKMAGELYGNDLYQQYARLYDKEAVDLLRQADASGHILAKRMLGLATIRGWGIPANTEAGFKQVIDSIELAKAWDKATAIFTELGLNSPEFFSALTSYRAHNSH